MLHLHLLVILCVINVMGYMYCREVTRRKSKSGAMIKHQRIFVVLKTTSNVRWVFKSGTAPLYRSLVTSLYQYMYMYCIRIPTAHYLQTMDRKSAPPPKVLYKIAYNGGHRLKFQVKIMRSASKFDNNSVVHTSDTFVPSFYDFRPFSVSQWGF